MRLRRVGKYWAMFATQMVNALAYPIDLAGRSVSIVLFMWVFIHLWRVTYRSVGQQEIAGLTLGDTLWYLMLAEAIWLSKPRVSSAIAQSVRDGSIAYVLNKPYSFPLYHLSVALGDSVLRLGLGVTAGGALIWLAVGPPPEPRGLLLALPAVAAAWLIDFCQGAMIGLAAFLAEDVAAFEWIYSKLVFVLGGLLIPIDFFPGWLRVVAQALPFAYTVYAPARLFVQPEPARLAGVLGGQAFWLLVLGLLLAFLYRQGTRRLVINGG